MYQRLKTRSLHSHHKTKSVTRTLQKQQRRHIKSSASQQQQQQSAPLHNDNNNNHPLSSPSITTPICPNVRNNKLQHLTTSFRSTSISFNASTSINNDCNNDKSPQIYFDKFSTSISTPTPLYLFPTTSDEKGLNSLPQFSQQPSIHEFQQTLEAGQSNYAKRIKDIILSIKPTLTEDSQQIILDSIVDKYSTPKELFIELLTNSYQIQDKPDNKPRPLKFGSRHILLLLPKIYPNINFGDDVDLFNEITSAMVQMNPNITLSSFKTTFIFDPELFKHLISINIKRIISDFDEEKCKAIAETIYKDYTDPKLLSTTLSNKYGISNDTSTLLFKKIYPPQDESIKDQAKKQSDFKRYILDKNGIPTEYDVLMTQPSNILHLRLLSQFISTSHTTKLFRTSISNIVNTMTDIQVASSLSQQQSPKSRSTMLPQPIQERTTDIYNLDHVYQQFCQEYYQQTSSTSTTQQQQQQQQQHQKWFQDFYFIRIKLFNQHFNKIPPLFHLFPPTMPLGAAISRHGLARTSSLEKNNPFNPLIQEWANECFPNGFDKTQYKLQEYPQQSLLFSPQQQILYIAVLYAYHKILSQLPKDEQLEHPLFEPNLNDENTGEFAFKLMFGLSIDTPVKSSHAVKFINQLFGGDKTGTRHSRSQTIIHHILGPPGTQKSYLCNLVAQTIMAHKPRGNLGMYDEACDSYIIINPTTKEISISSQSSILNEHQFSFLVIDTKDPTASPQVIKIDHHTKDFNARYMLRFSSVQAQVCTEPYQQEKNPVPLHLKTPPSSKSLFVSLLPIMPSWEQQIMSHIKSSLYYYSPLHKEYEQFEQLLTTQIEPQNIQISSHRQTSFNNFQQQDHTQFLDAINHLQYDDFQHFFITTPKLSSLLSRTIPAIQFSHSPTSSNPHQLSTSIMPFNFPSINSTQIDSQCTKSLHKFIEDYIFPSLTPQQTKIDTMIKDFKSSSQFITGLIPTQRSTNSTLSFLNLQPKPPSSSQIITDLSPTQPTQQSTHDEQLQLLSSLPILRYNNQQFPYTKLQAKFDSPLLLAPVYLLSDKPQQYLDNITHHAYSIAPEPKVAFEIQLCDTIITNCHNQQLFPLFPCASKSFKPAEILITTSIPPPKPGKQLYNEPKPFYQRPPGQKVELPAHIHKEIDTILKTAPRNFNLTKDTFIPTIFDIHTHFESKPTTFQHFFFQTDSTIILSYFMQMLYKIFEKNKILIHTTERFPVVDFILLQNPEILAIDTTTTQTDDGKDPQQSTIEMVQASTYLHLNLDLCNEKELLSAVEISKAIQPFIPKSLKSKVQINNSTRQKRNYRISITDAANTEMKRKSQTINDVIQSTYEDCQYPPMLNSQLRFKDTGAFNSNVVTRFEVHRFFLFTEMHMLTQNTASIDNPEPITIPNICNKSFCLINFDMFPHSTVTTQ